jgi:hypothetical protein
MKHSIAPRVPCAPCAETAGFLGKRGHVFKTWNRRFFVLRGPWLVYSKDAGQKIKGEVGQHAYPAIFFTIWLDGEGYGGTWVPGTRGTREAAGRRELSTSKTIPSTTPESRVQTHACAECSSDKDPPLDRAFPMDACIGAWGRDTTGSLFAMHAPYHAS